MYVCFGNGAIKPEFMESVTKGVNEGFPGLMAMLQQHVPMLVVFSILYFTILKQDMQTRESIHQLESVIIQMDHKFEKKFLNLERRMDVMNTRITKIEADIVEIKSSLKDHETRLSKLEK